MDLPGPPNKGAGASSAGAFAVTATTPLAAGAVATQPAVSAASSNITCPPKGFDSVPNFDVQKYIAAPWFAIEQVPVPYQPLDSFYCVSARYTPINPKDLAQGIKVENFARNGSVTGPALGTSGPTSSAAFQLMALPWPAALPSAPSTRASKLLVGPKALITRMPPAAAVAARTAGPYWVVATGPSKDAKVGYDWAIISGGAPSQQTAGGCMPPNGSGLWLFSRSPSPSKDTVAAMRAEAMRIGFDLSQLRPVAHAGCKYGNV